MSIAENRLTIDLIRERLQASRDIPDSYFFYDNMTGSEKLKLALLGLLQHTFMQVKLNPCGPKLKYIHDFVISLYAYLLTSCLLVSRSTQLHDLQSPQICTYPLVIVENNKQEVIAVAASRNCCVSTFTKHAYLLRV